MTREHLWTIQKIKEGTYELKNKTKMIALLQSLFIFNMDQQRIK